MATENSVSIVVGNIAWQGWDSVQITRSIEQVPSNFWLTGTEKYPGRAGQNKIDIMPSSPCKISIGSETVLTGYVDGRDYELTPGSDSVSVVGRSKLSDLCDCSGELASQQSVGRMMGSLAKILCDPYGISVSLPNGDTPTIPAISTLLTESGYETLERIARVNAKLLYDDADGNLVICAVGGGKHVSGFQEGVNIQSVQSTLNVAERYTSIAAIWYDTSILSEGTDAQALPYVGDQSLAVDTSFLKRADGKARYRPLLLVAEQGNNQSVLVPQRVRWEMARRWGRSQGVHIEVDSWRDSAGKLWTPNYYADISIPSCKVSWTWIISTVTYIRDYRGTVAQLTLMSAEAFVPQPSVAYSFDAETLAAAKGSATGAQSPAGSAPKVGGGDAIAGRRA